MKATFKCANCLKELSFSVPNERITLICQSCGCPDLTFNMDLVITPANPGQPDIVESISLKAGEPFLGVSPKGNYWAVSSPKAPEVPHLTLRKKG